jgi:hypothetical protein
MGAALFRRNIVARRLCAFRSTPRSSLRVATKNNSRHTLPLVEKRCLAPTKNRAQTSLATTKNNSHDFSPRRKLARSRVLPHGRRRSRNKCNQRKQLAAVHWSVRLELRGRQSSIYRISRRTAPIAASRQAPYGSPADVESEGSALRRSPASRSAFSSPSSPSRRRLIRNSTRSSARDSRSE